MTSGQYFSGAISWLTFFAGGAADVRRSRSDSVARHIAQIEQQAVLMLHRARALLIRQQTMLANAFRAHLAEFGIVVAQGIRHVRELIERVFGKDPIDLPALARTALRPLVAQLMELRLQIKAIEKELLAWHRTSQESRRLETIPGVGFITATANCHDSNRCFAL